MTHERSVIHQLDTAGVCWREFTFSRPMSLERFERLERAYNWQHTGLTCDGELVMGVAPIHRERAAAPASDPVCDCPPGVAGHCGAH